ncbi:unnamed protein product, partial [Staurois parvus]
MLIGNAAFRQSSPHGTGDQCPDDQCSPISATCQCPSMPHVSFHQCLPVHMQSMTHISVHQSCLSVQPISVSQCHLSVLPISATYQ